MELVRADDVDKSRICERAGREQIKLAIAQHFSAGSGVTPTVRVPAGTEECFFRPGSPGTRRPIGSRKPSVKTLGYLRRGSRSSGLNRFVMRKLIESRSFERAAVDLAHAAGSPAEDGFAGEKRERDPD